MYEATISIFASMKSINFSYVKAMMKFKYFRVEKRQMVATSKSIETL